MKKFKNKIFVLGFIFFLILISVFIDFIPFNIHTKNRSTPRLSDSQINLITPENKTYVRRSGQYLCSYDFENLGNFDGTYGRIAELDRHKNIFKIQYGFSYTLQNQFSRLFGTIEFYFRTEDATSKTIMSLKGLGVTPHIYLYVLNKDWYFLDNDTFRVINLTGSYKALDNVWHHIRIDFETTTGGYLGLSQEKWTLTVDGKSSDPLNMHSSEEVTPPYPINEVWLASYVNQPNGASFFDAFGYSWDTSYNIGDNLEEGLPLKFESAIDFDWMAYSLDSSANVSIPGNKTIPMPSYGTHTVQIFGNDSFGGGYQSFKRHFVIGTINIITPNKNTIWEEGKSYNITWTSSVNISSIDIEIYKGTTLKFSEYGVSNTEIYSWYVPNGVSIGTDWIIKITDSSNSTNFGFSEQFEVITSIIILSPDATSIFYSGKPHLITWTSTGNISFVDIEIYKNTTLKYSIANETANEGKFFWLIPFSIEAGIDWNVKIIDSHNSSIYAISDNFEIYTKKSITITNPSSETHWEIGTPQYITWSYTGEITNVDIEIFKGATLKYLISGTENDEAKFWEIPLEEEIGNDWKIRISDSTNASIFDESDNFEIYYHPNILVTSPHVASRWEHDKSYFISWSVSMRSNISAVNIEIYKGVDLLYSLGNLENDGNYLWNIPYDPPPGTDWSVKIINSKNSSMYGWSDNFEIYTDKSITLLTPTSLSSWGIPSSHLITWSTVGSISHVNIEISKGNTLKYSINETENTGSYNFSIPFYEEPGDDWRVKVSVSNYLSLNDISEQFIIYIVRTVTVIVPNKALTLNTNDYYDIVWITNGTISHVKIDLYRADSYMMTITSRTMNDGRYLFRVESNIEASTDYKIKISDADDSSVFDLSDEEFEIALLIIPGYNILIILGLFSTVCIFVLINKKRSIRNINHKSLLSL